MLFDAGVDIGKGADSTGNRAGGDFGTRRLQAVAATVEFGIGQRQLDAECGGFGMDSVRTANRRRHFMLESPPFDGCQQGIEIGQHQIGGAHQLHIEAGVEHIRRGHALMHEAGIRADKFA